jgi:hypothetical protein
MHVCICAKLLVLCAACARMGAHVQVIRSTVAITFIMGIDELVYSGARVRACVRACEVEMRWADDGTGSHRKLGHDAIL